MPGYVETLYAYAAEAEFAKRIAADLGARVGTYDHHRFPDGESLFRVEDPVAEQGLTIITDLCRPDDKYLPLVLFTETLRDLGAASIGLVAPYLPYMRQDRRFQAGEGVTSRYFAAMLARHFDWLVTVDPHLHRYHDLAELYPVPTRVVHAAPRIAEWIATEIEQPVLIGPDSESAQWVGDVAEHAGSPVVVLEKTRHSDHEVEVSVPDVERWRDRTPVLVDDIISSGHTMLETLAHLRRLHLHPPVCVGVHAIFAGDSYQSLNQAGAARVVTTNTIPHPSNAIDISDLLADAVLKLTARL